MSHFEGAKTFLTLREGQFRGQKSRSGMEKFGFRINIPDPKHCYPSVYVSCIEEGRAASKSLH
jgi:hypothetical protein